MVAQFYLKGTLAENVLRLWTAALARTYKANALPSVCSDSTKHIRI